MELSHTEVCQLLSSIFDRLPNIVSPEDISHLARCLRLENLSDGSIRILDSILANFNDIFGNITPQTDALMSWCFERYIILIGEKPRHLFGDAKYGYDKKLLCERFYYSHERELIKKIETIYNSCDIYQMVYDTFSKTLFRYIYGDSSKKIMGCIRSIYISRGLGLRPIVTVNMQLNYIGNNACMKDCDDSQLKNKMYRKIITLCIRYIHKTIRNIFETNQCSQLFDYIDIRYDAGYAYRDHTIVGGVFHYFPNSKPDYSDEFSFSTNDYTYHTSPPPQLTRLLYDNDISLYKYCKYTNVSYYTWVIPVMIINFINDFCDTQQQVTQTLITSLLSEQVDTYPKECNQIKNMIKKAILSLKNPSIYSVHEPVKYTLGSLCDILSKNDCIEMINNLYSEIPKFITENSTLVDKINFFRHITRHKVLFGGNSYEHTQKLTAPKTEPESLITILLPNISHPLQLKIQKLTALANDNNFDPNVRDELIRLISTNVINTIANQNIDVDIFARVESVYGSETVQYIFAYVPVDFMSDVCNIFVMNSL